MLAVLDYLVFAAAFAGAVYAIMATLLPAMPRVVAILSGRGDPAWAAEPQLAVTPRRRVARLHPAPSPVRAPALHEAA